MQLVSGERKPAKVLALRPPSISFHQVAERRIDGILGPLEGAAFSSALLHLLSLGRAVRPGRRELRSDVPARLLSACQLARQPAPRWFVERCRPCVRPPTLRRAPCCAPPVAR